MPIRMNKDDDSNEGYSGGQGSKSSGGSGGRGGLPGGNILAMLLPLLLRYPKLLIVVVVLGGGFFLFNKGCSSSHTASAEQQSTYARGATLDQDVYDKNEVFAALDNGEPLPERVSLEKYTPTAKDQGQQGSCVGWGSTYNGRTILEAVRTGQDPNKIAFSPAFTYNQIGLEGCQGTYITKAVELLSNTGSVAYNDFPYTDQSCQKQPDNYLLQDAGKYKMKGATRLSISGDDYTVDVNAIRQNLARNAPVIIGMSVGGSFMQDMQGQEYWQPNQDDYQKNNFGGHCMCVIGYDDQYFKNDGAFLIQNSWGPNWGKNGKAWVSYKDFVEFANEAYGIDAMPSTKEQTELAISIALVDKESGSEIQLENKGNNTFASASNLKIGQKFKVKITNTSECYIYIFGKESDNGSYVLFPYTAKHSAYCGITGTRIFPRDYSMEVDKVGNKDVIGILVSKQKLDYKTLNETLNADKGTEFASRLFKLMNDEKISDVTFQNSDGIKFTAETNGKSIVPLIIEITK
jgi:C1A family cysteine protease